MEHLADWTGRFRGSAVEVARPATTDEVAQVLRSGFAVTTRGGNTSLVGGAVPASDRPTVLLETGRLGSLGEVDLDAGQITVGAGATLSALQDQLAGTGWIFGVDLASRGSATIGGMAATNAGGIRVVRYGMMRAQVLGVQAVLPDGTVIDDTSGLPKNNTGYALSQLLVGSEGTLGVIIAARLRLHASPPPTILILLPIETLAQGLAFVGRLRRLGLELFAAEVFDNASSDLVGPQASAAQSPWYLLVEVAGSNGDAAAADAPEALVAVDARDRRRLWEVREGLTDAWGRAAAEAGTIVQKFDVSLPPGELDTFSAAARQLGPTIGMFGHLADGNLHLEVIDAHREWDADVLGLLARHRGSISAEHGIGQAKRDYLHLSRSPAEIAAMRTIKSALDPDEILNPGVLFPVH